MKHAFNGAGRNSVEEPQAHFSQSNSGNRSRKQSVQLPAAGRYRPGYPIAPEQWDAFMKSRRWQDAPKIFMPLYAEEKKRSREADIAETESSIMEQTARDPLFFGLNLVCGGREFADEVDKNEMLRILCAETVHWGFPVTDFVLLDHALHMIVCLENTQMTAQENLMKNAQKNQTENHQKSRMENARENRMGATQKSQVENTRENRMGATQKSQVENIRENRMKGSQRSRTENAQGSRMKYAQEGRGRAVPERPKSILSGERWQTYMLNQFVLSLERRYQEYYAQRMELPCSFLPRDILCRYKDPGQALEACCKMHALPVKLGFTDDIRLYWFSGYNTVRGKFAWNFMDPTGLLKTLSSRPDKAVRQYLASHRACLAQLAAEQAFMNS